MYRDWKMTTAGHNRGRADTRVSFGPNAIANLNLHKSKVLPGKSLREFCVFTCLNAEVVGQRRWPIKAGCLIAIR